MNTKKTRPGGIPTLMLSIALSLLLVACQGSTDVTEEDETDSEPAEESTTQADAEEPAETAAPDPEPEETEDSDTGDAAFDLDATVRVAHAQPPGQWDPHLERSTAGGFANHTPVYESLVTLNGEDLSIEPMLAESWEISDDGLTYTFQLREDVQFHNGEALDAEAVAANFERAASLEEGVTSTQLQNLESVDVVGEHSVALQLVEPDPSFLIGLAFWHAGRIVSPEGLANLDALATEPSGSGPFRLAEQTDDRTVFERVDEHWDTELMQRAPQRLENVFIGNDEARYRAVETGDVDVATISLWRPELDVLIDGGEFVHHSYPLASRSRSLWLHYDRPLTSDPLVRQAINLALNRDEFAVLLDERVCQPSASPLAEGVVGYVPELDETYTHDPERAREMLEEAGVAGETFQLLTVAGVPVFETVATVVQAQLNAVGLNVEVTGVAPAESLSTWRQGEYDGNIGTVFGADPHFIFEDFFIGLNVPGTAPDDFVALERAANAEPVGSDERAAAFEEVSGYLLDDPLNATLCQAPGNMIARPGITGLTEMPWTHFLEIPSLRHLGVAAE